jgi:hypothetical protein
MESQKEMENQGREKFWDIAHSCVIKYEHNQAHKIIENPSKERTYLLNKKTLND